MVKTKFKGSIPAVITPFNDNEDINFDQLERHIDFLISGGSHGLVSCGTTGDSPTLSHDEHKSVTEAILKFANGKVPVMSGCGSNSTKESIEESIRKMLPFNNILQQYLKSNTTRIV